MVIEYRFATENDAEVIGELILQLTQEICLKTNSNPFSTDLVSSASKLRELILNKNYAAIIGISNGKPVAVSTFTESYALYAGGKIGIIPEFYVVPEFRSTGIGAELISEVKKYGRENGWSCIELCTPPLPEFERTLNFYQASGLVPVGGRKMRQYL